MNGWQNKTILITGAGSGIGLALVKKALAEGANVSALVRRPNEELQKISQPFLLYQGDVRSREDIRNWLLRALETFNTIDVVINNAGAMYYMDITQPDYQQMKTMIDTNCLGFIHLIQEVLPQLLKSPQGHWINITSDAGRQAFPGLAIYSGTKAFVEFSARAMRQELMKHQIKITNIQPGNVQTPLHNKSTDKEAVERYGTIDSGQYLAPDDVVNAIHFALATPFEVAVNEILIEPFSESI
ncbi:SDR family oxidoreductase [Legionella israelensis]|uniref:SDR family oxidoreductase n=1 Tax=Legionella israelensis TaxID=454 RepID=UPI00117CD6D5|nr:SDR family oxidoreductase [Legionella israelensis]QDP71318.1 SDR family oxidoreductase [Legionella israelensis]